MKTKEGIIMENERPNFSKLTQGKMKSILDRYDIRIVKLTRPADKTSYFDIITSEYPGSSEAKFHIVNKHIDAMMNDFASEIADNFDEPDLDSMIHKFVLLSSLAQIVEERINDRELSATEMKVMNTKLLMKFNDCLEAKMTKSVVATQSPINTIKVVNAKPADITANNSFDYTRNVSTDSIRTHSNETDRGM